MSAVVCNPSCPRATAVSLALLVVELTIICQGGSLRGGQGAPGYLMQGTLGDADVLSDAADHVDGLLEDIRPSESRESTSNVYNADVSRLQRVGRRIDADGDMKLSFDELRNFAQTLRAKEWWDQTTIIHARADHDRDGLVSSEELRTSRLYSNNPGHQAERFGAADVDGDGLLDKEQMHAFLHPELGGKVLQVEVAYQLGRWDADADSALGFSEFASMCQAQGDDFDPDGGLADFKLHDANADGKLDADEFGHLLQGHHQLLDNIGKVLGSVDSDGDGHIHMTDEVPHQVGNLLDSEFVEDFFFHRHAQHHEL